MLCHHTAVSVRLALLVQPGFFKSLSGLLYRLLSIGKGVAQGDGGSHMGATLRARYTVHHVHDTLALRFHAGGLVVLPTLFQRPAYFQPVVIGAAPDTQFGTGDLYRYARR